MGTPPMAGPRPTRRSAAPAVVQDQHGPGLPSGPRTAGPLLGAPLPGRRGRGRALRPRRSVRGVRYLFSYLFPSGREIDERYIEKALAVIHEQLTKAAVRLAGVLNMALGPH